MNLPVYKAIITDDIDGIQAISLVEYPATEIDFLTFKKEEKKSLSYSISNEEKREILCVIMVADKLIYRHDNNGYEYYITYDADTIKSMAIKLLKDHNFNNINIEHSNLFVDGISLVELFIKDDLMGISPKGFEDVSNGSLFARYKVDNENIWNDIKNGAFKSVSLEGYFTTELEDKENKLMDEIIDLLNKLNKK